MACFFRSLPFFTFRILHFFPSNPRALREKNGQDKATKVCEEAALALSLCQEEKEPAGADGDKALRVFGNIFRIGVGQEVSLAGANLFVASESSLDTEGLSVLSPAFQRAFNAVFPGKRD